jgi:dTMP kinase
VDSRVLPSFVTFEGGEGSGKSTQARRLAEHLQMLGHRVCLTREPGGTASGEKIRDLVVSGATDAWSPIAEALLMNAARDAHLQEVIRPALEDGKTVLCDRFLDSTRVYQGTAGGCPRDLIDTLEQHVVGKTRPDLTLVFDLDPLIGLARATERSQGHGVRFENKGLAFHQKLRIGFLDIAKAEPKRCFVIDASLSEDVVFQHVLKRLGLLHV